MIVSSWCWGSAWNSCQCLLLQHFSELRDISWQEISSLNRIFNFVSMQRYTGKEPRWSLHGEEGPAQIVVYLSHCHCKLLKNHSLLGRKGNGKEEESTLAFWKNYFSFHQSFSSGRLMVCGKWCASVSCPLYYQQYKLPIVMVICLDIELAQALPGNREFPTAASQSWGIGRQQG